MRKLIVEISASKTEQELDEDIYIEGEDSILDPDSLYDFYIHEIVTQPDYTWKVVDEEGNDVTDEYKYRF